MKAAARQRSACYCRARFASAQPLGCCGLRLMPSHTTAVLVMISLAAFSGPHSIFLPLPPSRPRPQDQYAPNCKYYVLRATAAFFGSITAPVLYNVVSQTRQEHLCHESAGKRSLTSRGRSVSFAGHYSTTCIH